MHLESKGCIWITETDGSPLQMYGQYKEDLEAYAKAEARRLKTLQKLRKKEETIRKKQLKTYRSAWERRIAGYFTAFWHHTFAKLGEDWVFLAVLGILTSLLSFGMDYAIAVCLRSSGIPEMKTILRGVVLKEYLTFRTLISKVVGLTCSLGSGLPIGKEGPFVHVASIVATLLSKLVTSFKGIYENESRTSEMLAAACAVGVACSFAAPIGGVLFSIEVTSVFFAVRNYWRGFFAACCGAMVYRLLAVWFKDEETITALFKTNFSVDFPFDPQELLAFALIGAFCGFAGALFVWLHRQIVYFNRRHKTMNSFLQRNRFMYPAIITIVISSLTFPLGLGQFMAAELTNHEVMNELFSNVTWSGSHLAVDDAITVSHWTTPYTNIYVNLAVFIIMNFVTTTVCATLPVPAGVFIPIFRIGAAFGRLVGECMAAWFPEGIRMGDNIFKILPGGYAVVGAAALSGSATHTVSTSVIVFELTGQMSHILPVIIAVLIANAIAQSLQPSIYDSIIQIKKLPYLPSIISTSSQAYNIYVDDIMVREIIYISEGATYREIKAVLKGNKRLQSFPLVESSESMILLGSVQRIELMRLLERHLGRERRLEEVARRQSVDEGTYKAAQEQERRMSRFEVIPVAGHGRSSSRGSPPPSPPMTPTSPKKSILKHSPMHSPYSTITSSIAHDSRLRAAFEAIFRKALTLQDANPSEKSDSGPPTPNIQKRVQLPKERVIDMSQEEQLAWEEEQLNVPVDFSKCHIDPAPFQLVERTSLMKVHSLFSMLGLNHAYVTAIGRLVGVVALKELRKAIENMQGGNFVRNAPLSFETMSILNNAYGNSDYPSEPPSEAASEVETPSESEEVPGRSRFVFNFKNIQRTSQTSPV
ncbi:chloride channel protein 2-like isoform X3 [Stegodyphus dumicola]|uniref:chloride channel protein 2-like isoform X3 n=1 Tax=Stegodyphus dumicola TaxID=202533 RepID=UPI0015A8D80F|nr:chloride channel protein 2-like isoform X3 [Stegodyphus dumicola]